MEPLWFMLGLVVLGWIVLGPILFFVQSSKISHLTDEIQRLRREFEKRSTTQTNRLNTLSEELTRLAEHEHIRSAFTEGFRASGDEIHQAPTTQTPKAVVPSQTPSTERPPHAVPSSLPEVRPDQLTMETVPEALAAASEIAPSVSSETSADVSESPATEDVFKVLGDRLASRRSQTRERVDAEQLASLEEVIHEPEPPVGESAVRRKPVAHAPEEPKWFNEMDASQWLSWVGAVAVMIGAGFGLKYAIEEQWLGPTGRVALGILGGVATFVGAAYAMKKDYRVLAEGLAGAAMGILYFSFYAGFQWYDLMPQLVAFGGMILVTAVGLSFAGLFSSLPAAVLAMIGGFLTPYMLSKGGGNISTLFSYILILDLGVLALATFRSWGRLHLLNFGGTLLIWIGWLEGRYQPEELWLTVAWITVFGVVFSLLGLWRHVIRKEESSTPDMALMLMTPIAYFAALYGLTKADYSDWHGIMALLVAAYYLGLGLFAFLRNPANNQIVVTLVGIGLSFVTLAVPLQLTGHWIVIAWAVESLLLIEIGLRYEKPGFRLTGFGLLAIVQMHMVMYAGGTLTGPDEFTTGFVRRLWEDPATAAEGKSAVSGIINGRSMSFLANAIVLAILAREYRRREKAARIEGADEVWKKIGIGGRVPDAGQISTILIPLVPVMVLAMGLLETFVFGVRAHWSVATHLSMLPIWLSLFALATVLAFRRMADVETLGALAKFLYGVTGFLFLLFLLIPFPDWGIVDAGLWGQIVINPRGFGFLTALGATLFGAIQFTRRDSIDAESQSIGNSLTVAVPLVLLGMCLTETFAFGQRHDWLWATQLCQMGFWVSFFSVATLIAARWLRNSNPLTQLSKLLFIGTMALMALLILTSFGDIVAYGRTVTAEAYSRVLLNPRGLCLLVGAGSLLFGVWGQADSEKRDHNFITALKMASPIVLLAVCLLESYAFGQRRDWIWASFVSATGICLSLFAYLVRLIGHKFDIRQSPLTGLSQVFYIALAAVIVVLFLGTLGDWGSRVRGSLDPAWTWPLFNPRGFCFLLAVLSAWAGRSQVTQPNDVEDREYLIPTQQGLPLGLFAYAVLFLMCTIEVFALGKQSYWNTGTALAITGIWAMLAITTLGVGLFQRSSAVRILGLGVFALTTVKVFLYDVWYLDKTIRWAAFIGLGVTLFATSFLYRRFRDQLKDWIKPICLLLAASLAWGMGSPLVAEEAGPDLSTQFSHRFELGQSTPVPAGLATDPNFFRVSLTPEIYDASQRNLDDIRLLSVDAEGVSTQIPYVLISPSDEFGQADQNLPMVSRQDVDDTSEFVFSAKQITDPLESLQLTVTSPTKEYVRALRLYGANQTDDGAWKLLVNDGYLVDRSRGSLRQIESTVSCPRSQFRYYRIVIENDRQPPLSITGCTARMVRRHTAPHMSYPFDVHNEVRMERHLTRAEMTLTGPVPIDRIEFEIGGAEEYHRNAQLLTVDVTSTSPVATVQLFHLAKVSPGHTAIATFSPQQSRRWRLEIQNGDDQPLRVISARASGIERSLAIPIKALNAAQAPVALYVGGQVSAPSYDLARISTVPAVERLTTLALLPGERNPTYREVTSPRPWAEDHRTLVWVMVLGGVVVLSVLAVTLLKAAAAREQQAANPETTPTE